MKALFILFFSMSSLAVCAQDIKPAEKMILGDSLLFLGIDFSLAKMVNASDMDQAIYIRDKHGPYWGIIGDYMSTHNNLKFDFEKKVVTCKTRLLDSSYTKLDSNWTVAKYDGLKPEQIAEHIKSYRSFPGHRVGFVFIIDQMNKKQTMLVMYGVYIDLSDNSVLKIIKGVGAPDGFGYSMYWATGIDEAYKYFTVSNHNYQHQIRHYFKKK